MSLLALAVSAAFVSAGMAQQKPGAVSSPAAGQKLAAAQAAPVKENWEKARGVIEKVNEAAREVTVKAHKEQMTFSVGDQTRISEGPAKQPLSDLRKGMQVTVEYKKEGNRMLAEWIDVTKNPEAKPATQAQTREMKKESSPGKAAEKK